MENKDKINYFSKNDCLEKINELKKFYDSTTDFYQETNEIETNKWRFALDICLKTKCPPGNYEIYGNCAPY